MALPPSRVRTRWVQWLKVLGIALAGLIVCLGLLFGWFLLTTPAPPPIPRTTAEDDTLPSPGQMGPAGPGPGGPRPGGAMGPGGFRP